VNLLIEFILLLFLAWCILHIGFRQKDYGIVCIDGFFLMTLGIYALTVPLSIGGFMQFSLGAVHFGLGFYIAVRSSIELLKKV